MPLRTLRKRQADETARRKLSTESVLGKPCIAAQTKRICIIIGPTEDCLVELDARVGLRVGEGLEAIEKQPVG